MYKRFGFLLFAFVAFFSHTPLSSKLHFETPEGINIDVSGKLGYASYADVWANLLNHRVDEDFLFTTKTGLDLVSSLYNDVVKALFSVRTKAIWGNNNVLKVSQVQLKDPGGFMQPRDESHFHTLNLPAAWFREAWFEVDLTRAFNMTNAPYHSLTIGSFPFQVGRGIALGDVYALNVTNMGFYTDGTVDQYAYAAKLTGGFSKNWNVSYDLYMSILQNNSTRLMETMAKTQSQAFKHNKEASRGAGRINYIIAARFNMYPYKEDNQFVKIEPYIVHNWAPEQTIEFYADATSRLNTLGCAGEFVYGNWEGGFDGAVNMGHQYVKGWDRNVVDRPNLGGIATYVYSDVYTVDPNKVTPSLPADRVVYNQQDKALNNAVYGVLRSTISNGKQIAGTPYYNSLHRFRAPYKNQYEGFMVVADLGCWVYKRNMRICGTAGVASGDLNPNANLADPLASLVDGNYKGFISMQELYAGRLVKSVFVMGGTKKLVRPLSTPYSGSLYSSVVDTFSNLAFIGMSMHYVGNDKPSKITINPNLLVYWEQFPGRKFDLTTGKTLNEKASPFLGTEFNVIARGNISENVTMDFMLSVFQPGTHYFDVQGQPFTPAQRTRLEKFDPQDTKDDWPVLRADTAYSFATGINYLF